MGLPMAAKECVALVIACMDYRFQAPMYAWLNDIGLEGRYDLICFPGASKELDQKILDLVRLAVELHKIREVYVVHHEDCGAYRLAGFQKEQELHAQLEDMKKAKKRILERYPQLKVRLWFLRLNSKEPEELGAGD
ncbi:MAG: carbonic anhydrase [Archaeoglobaceae archaeon]